MGEPRRAAIYCRLSRSRDGSTEKVEDQEYLCRELAARLGLTVAEVFSDNDVTAAKGNSRSRARPRYDALLAAIGAGEVSAVLASHTDRLHRNLRELEGYITVCGEGQDGVPTYTVRGGHLDLSTSNGRMIARLLSVVAQGEVEHMSERMRDGHERRRRQGIVRAGGRGGRAYGFAADGLTQVPAEAEVIREAAARVLAGEGTGSVCADLTRRGIMSVTGIPFSHGTLRKMLARPRLAKLMPDGVSEAAWEPVLDRGTWEAARAVLDDRAAGYAFATNARKYLLSGIAKCGACGAGLQIRAENRAGKRRPELDGYGCVKCRKVQRNAVMLERYLIGRVCGRLAASPEGKVPGVPALAARYAALDRQRREIEAVLEDPDRGSVTALVKRLDGVNARLAVLREASAGDARARLRAAHAGLTPDGFRALQLAEQRALVLACFAIRVLPASKRGPGFRREDVELTPLA